MAFFVGFFSRYRLAVQQLLNRCIHQAHAVGRAALHRIFQLVHLALTDEVGDCRCVDQNFQGGDTASLIGRRDQLL